ncbi:flagellar motor switch protein FliN [Oligoflexia bacterium]|nr:flagellar motor switch protein FliN [Oligoflexia bacterium]
MADDDNVTDQDSVDDLLAQAEAEAPSADAAAAPVDEAVEAGLEQVADAAADVGDAALQVPSTAATNIDFILDVPLAVTVEVGRSRMTIQDLLQLGQGSVIELEKLAGEPLDIFVNEQRVAIGEAVIINEKFGVRLREIISPEERLARLK